MIIGNKSSLAVTSHFFEFEQLNLSLAKKMPSVVSVCVFNISEFGFPKSTVLKILEGQGCQNFVVVRPSSCCPVRQTVSLENFKF